MSRKDPYTVACAPAKKSNRESDQLEFTPIETQVAILNNLWYRNDLEAIKSAADNAFRKDFLRNRKAEPSNMVPLKQGIIYWLIQETITDIDRMQDSMVFKVQKNKKLADFVTEQLWPIYGFQTAFRNNMAKYMQQFGTYATDAPNRPLIYGYYKQIKEDGLDSVDDLEKFSFEFQ